MTTTATANPPPARRPLAPPRAPAPAPSRPAPTPVRRPAPRPPAPSNPESRDALAAALKHETDLKEQLILQLQVKDSTVATLSSDNANLSSALNAAESRINDLYADQSRGEVELAHRIDISDKLRAQVRELEKEKRDIQRRYNEQTATFDAERQAFYDNEQHLKSRIQSLSTVRKQPDPTPSIVEPESEVEPDDEHDPHPSPAPPQNISDPESEPAEMTSLKLELSTLSTSYSSLQSTLVLLQTQLIDLKRVNHELQEENESYMILLRERTLNGQFDLMKQVGGGSSEDDDDGDVEEDDDDDDEAENTDVGSLRSTGRVTLDRVEEEDLPVNSLEQELERSLEPRMTDSPTSHHSRHLRQGRKRTMSTPHSPNAPRGESLADLPITGPGLDLAAELGRAENKDILAGNPVEDRDRPFLTGKGKRSKKGSDIRKVSTETTGMEPSGSLNDIDALRTEVKSLKDANKALSLYASKIIDRIISQEGFEHVLAADYEKEPPTPSTAVPVKSPPLMTKRRSQSLLVQRSLSNPTDPSRTTSPPLSAPKLDSPPSSTKAQRRSLSFDWKSFSLFNGAEKKHDPSLRQLTLKPGASVTGARKLETYEDEEDRRERERLNATMKLMGIEPPSPQPSPHSPAALSHASAGTSPIVTTIEKRFSFFGSKTNSETSSVNSVPSPDGGKSSRVGLGIGVSSNLTQEALEHAEAENSLAALDARERSLSAELALGGHSGFTEIAPRSSSSRRSRRSAGGSGSGSTVWSAGMSGGGEDGEE